jgi:hypothetical protein
MRLLRARQQPLRVPPAAPSGGGSSREAPVSEELRRVAGQVARDTVAMVAPDELVFFEAARAEFFRDPDRVVEGRRQRDEVLGYGMDELVQLVTPAALAIAAAVVGAAVDRAGTAVVDQAVGAGRRLLRACSGVASPLPRRRRPLPAPGGAPRRRR